jgi:hypothetical protein
VGSCFSDITHAPIGARPVTREIQVTPVVDLDLPDTLGSGRVLDPEGEPVDGAGEEGAQRGHDRASRISGPRYSTSFGVPSDHTRAPCVLPAGRRAVRPVVSPSER